MTHKLGAIDLRGKRVAIIGLQGSGKTELAKHLIRQHRSVFIIDPMDEYDCFDSLKSVVRFVPPNDDFDFSQVFDKIKSYEIDMMVVDEISRFCPSRARGAKPIRDFADICRHSNTAFVAIARRPGQVQTDFTELAHFIFVFRMRGKNDSIWLANQVADLPAAVHRLKPFHFICIFPDRTFEEFEPIPIGGKDVKRRRAKKAKSKDSQDRTEAGKSA